ncbi:MAG: hypothetical protein QOE86_713 [Solirubrobacteraceae bacterium]|jgi:hypothetical protein|nr:hypothetical protein [Solirubrobacteraceae bacterium]
MNSVANAPHSPNAAGSRSIGGAVQAPGSSGAATVADIAAAGAGRLADRASTGRGRYGAAAAGRAPDRGASRSTAGSSFGRRASATS